MNISSTALMRLMRLRDWAGEKESLEPGPQTLFEWREGGALRADLVGANRDANKLMDNCIPEILEFAQN
jgi:hypothetical protein